MFLMSLTLPEVLALDGKCSDKIQIEVDRAKQARSIGERHGLADGPALFVRDAVAEAQEAGRLIHRRLAVNRCAYTGRTAEWIQPPQGRARYPKEQFQRPFTAVEVAQRFVVVAKHASIGIDADVFPHVLPALRAELKDVRAEIPEAILGAPSPWHYSARVKARCCGWTGAEALTRVRREPCWFGLTCPGCGEKHRSDRTGFVLVSGEHEVIPTSSLVSPLEGRSDLLDSLECS